MRILVIGGGGREHALAWKLAASTQVEQIWVAPGNPGTALEDKVENWSVDLRDFGGVAQAARDRGVELVIIGPEQPLADGMVDVFQEQGLACCGPVQAAARLESSKLYCKEFLLRHRIPTAAFQAFDSEQPALAYLRRHGAPIVVKADGLAAGKGVVVAREQEQAAEAIRRMLSGQAVGDAGRRILLEECLEGEEASFTVMCDGERVLPLATAQDHKARDEGDQGPNTGGMGAYSPAPVVNAELAEKIMTRIIEPTVRGLAAEGQVYRGFLYAGLMITAAGEPMVLEYNCRLGDPEAQVLLPRLRSDFAGLCMGVAGHGLPPAADWSPETAVGVVLAARGYPGNYRTGEPIDGLEAAGAAGAKIFHAGTRNEGGRLLSNGGRVLCLTGMGEDIAGARQVAYAAAAAIRWPGAYYRRDIAHRALHR